ncbi:MAG: hypothetical protein ACRYF0_04265 [Janthinobacterium lividum]
MLHTFTIPVKPHVRKYLLHHLRADYKLTRLDAFGRHLRLLLERRRKNNFLNGFTERYTQTFGVAVEGNLILQKRLRALNSKEIIDFNNFVEDVIKTEFYGMVDNRRAFGLSQYGAIQQFRAKYDFQDEDITHDALKKAWQRYDAERRLAELAPKGVSVCPLNSVAAQHRLVA